VAKHMSVSRFGTFQAIVISGIFFQMKDMKGVLNCRPIPGIPLRFNDRNIFLQCPSCPDVFQ